MAKGGRWKENLGACEMEALFTDQEAGLWLKAPSKDFFHFRASLNLSTLEVLDWIIRCWQGHPMC